MDEEWYKKMEMRLKAADEFHHQKPDASAWNKMEAQLDDAFREKKRRRFLWVWMLLPLLAIGVWFFVNKIDKSIIGEKPIENHAIKTLSPSADSNKVLPDRQNASTANQANKITKQDKAMPLAAESDLIQKNIQPQKAADKINKPMDIAATNDGITASVKNKQQQLSRRDKNFSRKKMLSDRSTHKVFKRQAQDKTQADVTTTDNLNSATTGMPGKKKIVADKEEETTVLVNSKSALLNVDSSRQITMQDVSVVDTAKAIVDTAKALVVSDSVSKETKSKSRGKAITGFFIGTGASYSLSSIHINSITRGNKTLDFTIGYQFPRLKIAAGLLAGKILYDASPDDYKPTKPYNTYGFTVKTINADCYIIELPLSLSYTFYQKKQYRLFLTAGVASQFLKREAYKYTATRNDSLRVGTWLYQNENKHLFSVAQVSAGITYSINKKLVIEAEPFYKMPLRGIGHGYIKLHSLGIGIGLRYFPFYRRSKI